MPTDIVWPVLSSTIGGQDVNDTSSVFSSLPFLLRLLFLSTIAIRTQVQNLLSFFVPVCLLFYPLNFFSNGLPTNYSVQLVSLATGEVAE